MAAMKETMARGEQLRLIEAMMHVQKASDKVFLDHPLIDQRLREVKELINRELYRGVSP